MICLIISVNKRGPCLYATHLNVTEALHFQGIEPGRGYIISKIPEPHLFESFWKLVVEKNCTTVVVIDDMQEESVRSSPMMTSSNGHIFGVTGPLRGESIGHWWISLTKASEAEIWCFLWSAPEQTVEQTIEVPVIWDAIALIMMSMQWLKKSDNFVGGLWGGNMRKLMAL